MQAAFRVIVGFLCILFAKFAHAGVVSCLDLLNQTKMPAKPLFESFSYPVYPFSPNNSPSTYQNIKAYPSDGYYNAIKGIAKKASGDGNSKLRALHELGALILFESPQFDGNHKYTASGAKRNVDINFLLDLGIGRLPETRSTNDHVPMSQFDLIKTISHLLDSKGLSSIEKYFLSRGVITHCRQLAATVTPRTSHLGLLKTLVKALSHVLANKPSQVEPSENLERAHNEAFRIYEIVFGLPSTLNGLARTLPQADYQEFTALLFKLQKIMVSRLVDPAGSPQVIQTEWDHFITSYKVDESFKDSFQFHALKRQLSSSDSVQQKSALEIIRQKAEQMNETHPTYNKHFLIDLLEVVLDNPNADPGTKLLALKAYSQKYMGLNHFEDRWASFLADAAKMHVVLAKFAITHLEFLAKGGDNSLSYFDDKQGAKRILVVIVAELRASRKWPDNQDKRLAAIEKILAQ